MRIGATTFAVGTLTLISSLARSQPSLATTLIFSAVSLAASVALNLSAGVATGTLRSTEAAELAWGTDAVAFAKAGFLFL